VAALALGIVEFNRRTLGTRQMGDFRIRDETCLKNILPNNRNIGDGSLAFLGPAKHPSWVLIDGEWVFGEGCGGGSGGGGGGLASVITDGVTITGNGTAASPLKVRISAAANQALKTLLDGLHVSTSDTGGRTGPAFYTGPTPPDDTDLIWHQTAV